MNEPAATADRLLKGRVALVTGSTGGLGRSILEALAGAGADCVVHGLAPEEEGRKVAAEIAAAHGCRTLFDGADLSDVRAIEAMHTGVVAQLGPPDILVNNAAVRHFHAVEDFPAADWDRSLAVNVSAAFHLSRLTLPAMKARGWGRVLVMSSIYGSRGAAQRIDYVTTKTALLGFTRGLAIETAGTGVTCNALSPGTVLTPAIEDRLVKRAAAEGRTFEEVARDYAAARHPTGRFVEAADVAALAVFLCGPHSHSITGATMSVDGGWQAA